MEVGAVKQAFNNELIHLKKNLNQAKIQIIHKLTRKAKMFTEKKGPDKVKEKFKRKAESAVNEVLVLKKIKVKDLAQFIITHKWDLKDYLNKPIADTEKTCARLLLHKSLASKYKDIKEKYASVPINDLLMSREERRKLKKEAKEKRDKKIKEKNERRKAKDTENNWVVENIKTNESNKDIEEDRNIMSSDGISDDESDSESETDQLSENVLKSNPMCDKVAEKVENEYKSDDITQQETFEKIDKNDAIIDDDEQSEEDTQSTYVEELTVKKPDLTLSTDVKLKKKKSKDSHKNKNLNEKLLSRKFKRDKEEVSVQKFKVVDPFFITETGENYMSVAEPRQPDEVKEEHKHGNRKIRRAAMFGHVPKFKPRYNNFDQGTERQNGLRQERNRNNMYDNSGSEPINLRQNKNSFKKFDDNVSPAKEEKLHPSWEAKKKKSGILPFQGKKIVFND